MSTSAPRSPRRLTKPQRRAVPPPASAATPAIGQDRATKSAATPFLASIAAGAKRATVGKITRPVASVATTDTTDTSSTVTTRKRHNPS
jgi:hypothetical protein